MKSMLCSAAIASLLFAPALSFCQDTLAITEDGRKVILKKDGTWRPYGATASTPSEPVSKDSFKKPDAATAVYRSKGDRFMVWYNPNKWRQKKSSDEDKPTYEHVDGDVYAMILAERFSMSIEDLKELAMSNARKAAPDVRLVSEEERFVNGRHILCMRFDGTISGVPFTYYGYYFAGKSGIIQLITYTSQNLFDEYRAEMTDFLNGLRIKE